MHTEPHFEPADAERAAVRAAVAEVGQFIARLPSGDPGADRGLVASWAALVKLLALGEPRQLRECPHCGRVGMRAATLCGHCWAKLTDLPVLPADGQAAGGLSES